MKCMPGSLVLTGGIHRSPGLAQGNQRCVMAVWDGSAPRVRGVWVPAVKTIALLCYVSCIALPCVPRSGKGAEKIGVRSGPPPSPAPWKRGGRGGGGVETLFNNKGAHRSKRGAPRAWGPSVLWGEEVLKCSGYVANLFGLCISASISWHPPPPPEIQSSKAALPQQHLIFTPHKSKQINTPQHSSG